MALNTMLALEATQVAIIKYLRGLIGNECVGDYLPQDNNLKYFVHLKNVDINDIHVKGMERYLISCTFHVISDVKNGAGKYLELIEAVDSLTKADLTIEGYHLDSVEVTATHSFVDTYTEKHNRHGILIIDFKITKK